MKAESARLPFHIGLLFLALCVTMGDVNAEGEAPAGKAVFDARCGMCHAERDIAHWVGLRPDDDERAAWLDSFLQRHYPTEEDERAAIIEFIGGNDAPPG